MCWENFDIIEEGRRCNCGGTWHIDEGAMVGWGVFVWLTVLYSNVLKSESIDLVSEQTSSATVNSSRAGCCVLLEG